MGRGRRACHGTRERASPSRETGGPLGDGDWSQAGRHKGSTPPRGTTKVIFGVVTPRGALGVTTPKDNLCQPGFGPKRKLDDTDVKHVVDHNAAEIPTAEQQRAMLQNFLHDAESKLQWHICGCCGRKDHNTCSHYELHGGAALLENEKLRAILIRSAKDERSLDDMPA